MEILRREGLARIGRFQTDHGHVDTPNIMPVINPNIMTLPIEKMVRMGAQALITNSYIIRRNKDLKERALNEGLHKLIGFDGTIMTDSGTFQSYMYGEVEYQNADTVDFQIQIGSDISTILDIFSTPSDSHERRNMRWMRHTDDLWRLRTGRRIIIFLDLFRDQFTRTFDGRVHL
jgi:tRNA-guanine transglycosylases, various specificities